jgi:hypothetical protein
MKTEQQIRDAILAGERRIESAQIALDPFPSEIEWMMKAFRWVLED